MFTPNRENASCNFSACCPDDVRIQTVGVIGPGAEVDSDDHLTETTRCLIFPQSWWSNRDTEEEELNGWGVNLFNARLLVAEFMYIKV